MTGASAAGPRAVVVGAGPSGLCTAALLQTAGWQVTVLERLTARRPGTRAPTIWPPAMNVLDVLGVGDAVRERSHRVNRLRLRADGTDQITELGALACRTLPQGVLEKLLERRATGLGVPVIRGFTVDGVRFDDGVAVEVSGHGDDGRARPFPADLVVGADGAHSAVRGLLDLPSQGADYGTRFALLDVVPHAGRFDRDEVVTYTDKPGTLVTVPLPGEGMRLVAPLLGPAGTAHREGADGPVYLERLAHAHGHHVTGAEWTWRAEFTVAVRMVERFGVANVALIGDAAHVQSPAGGRGMNNGVEDAMTLATEVVARRGGATAADAVARYSAVRTAEIADELGEIKQTTDRWLADPDVSGAVGDLEAPGGGDAADGAGAVVAPRRSELDRVACLHNRHGGSNGAPWERPAPVGWRLEVSSVAPSGGSWPGDALLAVGVDPATTDVLAGGAGVRQATRARCVGLPEDLPDGVHALSTGLVVVGSWPLAAIRGADPQTVRTEITECVRKNDLRIPA